MKQYLEKRSFSSWSIRHPLGSLAIISVIIVLGGFFYTTLTVDLLPRVVYPVVMAVVNYPGADPFVMEETVTKVLESRMATTEDVVEMRSDTREGRANVRLRFDYGKDIDIALRDASSQLDRARGRLPIDIDPPTIFKFDPSQRPILELALSSEEVDLVRLRRWAEEDFSNYFLNIPGIASVDVAGGLLREVHVIVDKNRLEGLGLSVTELLRAIREENIDASGGRVTTGRREYASRTVGRFSNIDEIADIRIRVQPQRAALIRGTVNPDQSNDRIRLREVAQVVDTHREQRVFARLNGAPSVKVALFKQPNANTVEVANDIMNRIEFLKENRIIPANIHLTIIADQSQYIKNSIGSVSTAAVVGGSLAMLIVGLFLASFRRTFIIATSIPIAILATFMMMGLGNLTLNIISLGGLALGIGMLMDNSIVMLENIYRVQKEHPDPVDAAHIGSNQVAHVITASTMTNLASVLPFLLIAGLASMFFTELILTISFAIIASLLVAISLVPMLSAQLFKFEAAHKKAPNKIFEFFDRSFQKSVSIYNRLLVFAIRRRGWVILGTIFMFVGAIFLFGQLGGEFLPAMDDGRIMIRYEMPPTATVENTDAVARELESMIWNMPAVSSVFTVAGGRMWGSGTAEFSNQGSLDIQLLPLRERNISSDNWINSMRQNIVQAGIPEARINVWKPGIPGLWLGGAGDDVEIKLYGDDIGVLSTLADEVISSLKGVEGLSGLEKSIEEAKPELQIRIDRERAAELGLSVREIGETVRTAIDGSIASRYVEGDREYDIRVLYDRDQVAGLVDIENIVLYPQGRQAVPLRNIARVVESTGPVTITRENQIRMVSITGNVSGTDRPIGDVTLDSQRALAGLTLPDGYRYIFGGQQEAMQESNRQLLIIILLAIFLVYVVLVVLYESLLNPLVIMTTIPFALVGVIVALYVTSTPLAATAMLGIILLAGIVVNNAIVFVEFIEMMRRDENMSAVDAVKAAGPIRLRPIVMTTITTVIGMSPLAIGIGEGSETLQPLAIAVIGGLLFATFLTLFVIPNVYLIIHGTKDRIAAFLASRGYRTVTPEKKEEDESPAYARESLS
jgi:hydrophobe/amphiphile efflux-1 (HAE1) family protein